MCVCVCVCVYVCARVCMRVILCMSVLGASCEAIINTMV